MLSKHVQPELQAKIFEQKHYCCKYNVDDDFPVEMSGRQNDYSLKRAQDETVTFIENLCLFYMCGHTAHHST